MGIAATVSNFTATIPSSIGRSTKALVFFEILCARARGTNFGQIRTQKLGKPTAEPEPEVSWSR
jgi:hypothetical protein